MKQFPFPRAPKPADTTLLIAGHGTERNANSRKAVERQVELIRALKIFAEVSAVFMEEAPFIKGCHEAVKTKNIVVVPFFISDGLHVVEDIPVLLGEPERIVKERLAAGQPTWRNPTERGGKLIWYSPSVGTEPLLADVILERVKEAAAASILIRQTAKFDNDEPRSHDRRSNDFMKKLRIGFLSTAGIGKKNWKAIFNSGNGIVTAVASRDLNKSREFIDECQGKFAFAQKPMALGSYEELLALPDVDAVYIPLPTGLRQKWVLRAAAAGKHVICEKPCGISTAEPEKNDLRVRQKPRAIHGRCDVHAQPAVAEDPRNIWMMARAWAASGGFHRRLIFSARALFPAPTSAWTARWNPPAASATWAGITSDIRCGR